MRFKRCAVVAVGLLLGLSVAAHGQYAHTRGVNVVDGAGHPIQLKGTNLGNWLVPEGYMWRFDGGPQSPKEIEAYVTELIGPTRAEAFWKTYRDRYVTREDIQFIKAQGFNSVRVPLHWKFFQTDNAEGFRLLDRVVEWSREAGLYIILDLHAAEGGQTGTNIDDGQGYPWLMRDAGVQQRTVDLWARLAKHYRKSTTVLGYDLLNEPIPNYPGYEVLHPALEPLYKRMAAGIRAVDKNHILILGGAEWDGDFSVFGPPFDGNTIYQLHKYWMGVNQAMLAPFIAYREKYKVPIWLGESGENTDEWVGRFRGLLDANAIGWAFWPYKKMEAKSAPVTVARPAGWDQIVAYAKQPRGDGSVKARLKDRPAQDVIDAAMAELLENVQFAKCTVNAGYIRALLPGPGEAKKP
jgi:aryl-phospho-beta-D-glucosidase BglC (GH1 family)